MPAIPAIEIRLRETSQCFAARAFSCCWLRVARWVSNLSKDMLACAQLLWRAGLDFDDISNALGGIDRSTFIVLVERFHVVGCACHVGSWTYVSANFHVSSLYGGRN